MSEVEFFFDLSSPWTYLAFHNIHPIVSEAGAMIRWRPFLVGGVFNAVNDSMYASRANPNDRKNRHSIKWLKDWARLAGLPINFPSPYHPLKSVRAMRTCCALEDRQVDLFRFASGAFAAYFGDQRNLDDPSVLAAVADECGFDGAALVAQTDDPEIKERLKANTQEVIDRGGFGSPTIFIDNINLYFGNDQIPIVRQALLEGSKC
jgi:2-hydroxychromene-2-carboxylate isomerase